MILLGLFLIGTVVYYVISDIQLMKKGLNSIPRMKIYQSILTTQWVLVLLLMGLWWLIGFNFEELFIYDGPGVMESTMLEGQQLLGFITGAAVVMIVLPLILKKGKMAKALEKVDFMLPKTIGQRVTFFFIAVTAGVCEEIVFRGAMSYFVMNLPLDLPIWAVGVIVAVMFGLAHWYQGISGILQTGILGYVMFNLYIQTGSLLVPIILHFLIDVKFVFMPDWTKKKAINEGEIA